MPSTPTAGPPGPPGGTAADRAVRSGVRKTVAVIALGGLLFGYDTGVISGALLYITPAFDLSEGLQQVVVAALLAGAIVGALLAGAVLDRFGRRRVLQVAAVVFTIGALAAGLAPSAELLIAARVVLGVAIGVSSAAVPAYLAEIAPADTRGRIVSMNQLLITVGIFVSYLVGYALSSSANWRLMLALAAVPSVLMFLGLLRQPESPRWLASVGRVDEARDVLRRLRPAGEVDAELRDIADTLREESRSSYRDLLRPEVRPALRLGIGVAAANQLIGVNAVIYYAPTLLTQAGFGSSAAILAQVGIGLVNMVVTVLALSFIDRLGRRPLLIGGAALSTAALGVIGGLYLVEDVSTVSWLLVGALCVYIAAFAGSLGIAIWLVNSEVHATAIRGKAGSLGTFTHWGLDFVISLTVLTMISTFTETGTFWLFGVFGLLATIWMAKTLPETKGRSLEDVDAELRARAGGGGRGAGRGTSVDVRDRARAPRRERT